MKNRLLYSLLFAALGVNLIVGANIYLDAAQSSEKDSVYPNIRLFTEVLGQVHENYVDADKITYQDLIHGALKGMLDTLDPHSEFMLPEEHDQLKSDTEGEFGGVGIVVEMRDGYLTVVSPIDDTPGFRAGIMAGDRIVSINGKNTIHQTLPDAVELLRGKPGTKVTIGLFNPRTNESREVEIERAVIQVDTVKDINGQNGFPLSENNIGYVRLVQFGEKTPEELKRALRILDDEGMESLIMDLRDNPGGLLDAAVKVCEQFLPKGELVVSTEGRHGVKQAVYKSSTREEHAGLPIVILVNTGSASAAEIVSGCLQDWKRALILGEQTFGKGSVQSILPLPDKSALRLTTAKYYTPSHKVIHEKGITPDVIVEMSIDTERDLLFKRVRGSLETLPEKERERLAKVKDVQLERAIDLLTGIKILASRMQTAPDKMAKR